VVRQIVEPSGGGDFLKKTRIDFIHSFILMLCCVTILGTEQPQPEQGRMDAHGSTV
jgi:hypothetical protein